MPATVINKRYDVVICGNGLAGLCLARQLRLWRPELTVAALDKLTRPLPEAAFKVGESTVDPGGKYLSDVLGLRDYLHSTHIDKFGFRFFFARPGAPFEERPEFGRSIYTPNAAEYQLDRGVFENDMRQKNIDLGVDLFEGAEVVDVALGDGDADHMISFKHDSGQVREVRARWVIDAMGRRRWLQKKLGLTKDIDAPNSSCWFRVEGIIDVADFVSRSNTEWHARVPGNHPHDADYSRRNSTIHMVGDGYWVWIIMLKTGHTSIGIVTREEMYPFAEYNTYERAYAWLQEREPELAAALAGKVPLDFKTMRRYTYSSQQMLSADRWACIGEAAVFSDPYFANGSDLMGIENSMVCEAIGLDAEGRFDDELAGEFNRLFLSYFELNTQTLQSVYPYFGRSAMVVLKFAWDACWFFAFHGFFTYHHAFKYRLHELCANRDAIAEFERLYQLNAVMIRLFDEWARRGGGNFEFTWLDYFRDIPFMREIGRDVLRPRYEPEAPVKEAPLSEFRRHLQVCEEVAHAFFAIAVAEVLPEQQDALPEPLWLNLDALGLDPSRWREAGLFQPGSPPRDFQRCVDQLYGLFDEVAAPSHHASGGAE